MSEERMVGARRGVLVREAPATDVELLGALEAEGMGVVLVTTEAAQHSSELEEGRLVEAQLHEVAGMPSGVFPVAVGHGEGIGEAVRGAVRQWALLQASCAERLLRFMEGDER